ncbi:hypothetical protein [Xenorhabdus sp. KJ12.1]|uniref:hypothetical protein n=1 Tax=Xenorhabdus sp. KJ12.1 TaxID=1851571 RepID=UPI000C054AD0|nr:hypothetical protein [Xenorhabdus sp. KJ12.1]PHM68637.1 hypothetical protein Xekj_03174 [Xenorhabdus sp. KJ12.1]
MLPKLPPSIDCFIGNSALVPDGVADRWLDIAFVHRNLREEISVNKAAEFLTTLGDFDNVAKREFFEQLDELF